MMDDKAKKELDSQFSNTINWLRGGVHPPPEEFRAEFEFVIEMLTNGKGYLTKRTPEQPYCRIVFFDEHEEMSGRVRDGVYSYDSNAIK